MKKPSAARNTRSQAFHGALWTFFGFGGSQFIRLGGNLVLAWLLFPEAFGLMALVNVFIRGLQMFSDLGIGPAVIQNPRGDEQAFRNVAWTMQIIRGTTLWLVACLLAWPVAQFYSEGRADSMMLLQILPVVGFTAFLSGFTSTSIFVMNRRMKIGTITLLELASQLISVGVMVVWALWIGRSIWALVAGGIVQSLVRLLLSHVIERGHHDRIAWNKDIAKELARFGGWIFASTVISFLVTNLDRLVLGRLLTLAELGIYSIAMTFARLGMQITTRLSNVVLFPLLTKRQHQPGHLMKLCYRGRHLVLLAGGAVCVAFTLLAPVFFQYLYDERYHAAGPLSRWLSIYIWGWIMVATLDRVPLAVGKTRILFHTNLINIVGMVASIPGYLGFGMPGFIIGLSMGQLAALLYVNRNLPCARLKILRQSMVFTLCFGSYGLLGVFLLRHLPEQSVVLQIGASMGLAAFPILWAGLGIIRELKRKNVS
jgi:O-antigen/teichoic acid export membrane protein